MALSCGGWRVRSLYVDRGAPESAPRGRASLAERAADPEIVDPARGMTRTTVRRETGIATLTTERIMRRLLRAAVVACALLAAPAGAQDATSEAAIRAIVAEQAAAWDAGDGARYAAHVAPDVSFTNLFGMVMYGAPAFAARHREILATFYKGTTKRHHVRRVRFVTPDVAVVDIDNEVHGVTAMPAGIAVPADGVVRTQLMEVFVRRGGRWWVEAYHNVDVKPALKPAGKP
jgi:uncharacterized protein (TIGR02246 family)